MKAQGDGWLMTVTLIEGENLSPTEESSYANPYVVFTCSGKRRTSSVKLRTLKPRWRGTFPYYPPVPSEKKRKKEKEKLYVPQCKCPVVVNVPG